MSATRKRFLVVAVLVVVVLGSYFGYRQIVYDPAASPELSKPPDLLTQQQIGDRRLLFDGKTTAGWKIDGPAQANEGTLVLGGDQPTAAYLAEELGMEFKIRFDFFQEGSGKAEFRMKPILLDPKDPFHEQKHDAIQDLRLTGLVYKRWHNVRVAADYRANHFDMSIGVESLGDGHGRGGGQSYGFSSTKGCRCKIGFEVGAGSRLSLRNVLLETPAKPRP